MKRIIQFISALIIIILLMSVVFFKIDEEALKQGREPIFSKKINELNLQNGAIYKGLGYKLRSYKLNHEMVVNSIIFYKEFDKN